MFNCSLEIRYLLINGSLACDFISRPMWGCIIISSSFASANSIALCIIRRGFLRPEIVLESFINVGTAVFINRMYWVDVGDGV